MDKNAELGFATTRVSIVSASFERSRVRWLTIAKPPFLDYKSAALPTELCRHLREKIAFSAASANRFLYAFSIRLGWKPFETLVWARRHRTRANSHRFNASAMTFRLRAWSGNHIRSSDGWTDGRACVSASDEKVCQTTAVQNRVRYALSGTYSGSSRGNIVFASPIGLEECTALTECHWLLLRIYSDLFLCWPVCPPGLSPGRCNQPPLCYDHAFGNKRHGRWRHW